MDEQHTDTGVADYLDGLDGRVRVAFDEAWAAARDALPPTNARLSYRIPTLFVGKRRIVHLAGWSEHISIYPAPTGDEALAADLERYRSGKGTLRFPIDEPMPVQLICRVARALYASAVPTG